MCPFFIPPCLPPSSALRPLPQKEMKKPLESRKFLLLHSPFDLTSMRQRWRKVYWRLPRGLSGKEEEGKKSPGHGPLFFFLLLVGERFIPSLNGCWREIVGLFCSPSFLPLVAVLFQKLALSLSLSELLS